MLSKAQAEKVIEKLKPTDPDWCEAMELDPSDVGELFDGALAYFSHQEEAWRMAMEGVIASKAVIKQHTDKAGDITIQVALSGYVTDADAGRLHNMGGRTVELRIWDPDVPLPLDYSIREVPREDEGGQQALPIGAA